MRKKRVEDVSDWIHNVIGNVNTMTFGSASAMPTPHDEDLSWWHDLYSDKDFVDDMNGFVALDREMAIKARKVEID